MTETCRRAYRGVLSGLAAVLLALPAGCGGHDRGLSDAELTAMIDSLLPAIAEASGLEVRRPVRFAMQSRAEARAFIERQLDEQFGHEELGGMTGAYRAFGLIPDTLDLRALMLELLTEQVVGYYDPATDRLYVLDEAQAHFPPGVRYEVAYDSSRFVGIAIEQVVKTLLEAVVLVFLVMMLFMQNLRATLIPTLVVPIALLGTFAVMLPMGFSINVLTL
ncbi:MAG: efflux RND transporter permease subunit, partial [Gemmatimonadota bacterium]